MSSELQKDVPVLIVGGGPVGMTMALCLAKRGIASYLVEMRTEDALPDVKCNHIASRSMELFRSLGISQDLRAAGLPDEYPHDVSYRTSTLGEEIARIHIPGRTTRLTDHSGPDGNWPTPEPPHLKAACSKASPDYLFAQTPSDGVFAKRARRDSANSKS